MEGISGSPPGSRSPVLPTAILHARNDCVPMPGARTIEDVGHAQWNAHLNNAVRQALRQTLSERPLDPVAHIGRLC